MSIKYDLIGIQCECKLMYLPRIFQNNVRSASAFGKCKDLWNPDF